MKTMFKRMTAFAMAAMMMFAMAVSASATGTTYDATIYKNNKDTLSMADDAVMDGTTITEDDGVCHVTIPVQPIKRTYEVLGISTEFTGYITSIKIGETTYNVADSTPYTSSTISFDIESDLDNILGEDNRIDVSFTVVLYDADGNYRGTPNEVISFAPSEISADLQLDQK